jgi:hypothetical protein
MDEQQIRASLKLHESSPNVSIREYADRLIDQLGASVAARRKLYFDTRYWIHLRDAAIGRPKLRVHSEILNCVRSLVSAGSIVCPISDVAWLELSKQTDPVTRRATIELIEELSLGIALMGEEDRVTAELDQFITDPSTAGATTTLKDKVWVKATYALGFLIPTIPEFSAEQNLVAQKTSVDLFWQMKLSELDEVAKSLPPRPEPWEKSAANITANMQRYAHEIKSIEQAFGAEIAGALRAFKKQMRVLVIRRLRKTTGSRESIPDEEIDQAADQLLTGLANAFRIKPKVMATHVPSLYAFAMCHAAVRMDKTRKFNGHDLLDMHHASSGIPYHDAVFTESPLRTLVTAGNVALDKTFSCKVLSKEDDVLLFLTELAHLSRR